MFVYQSPDPRRRNRLVLGELMTLGLVLKFCTCTNVGTRSLILARTRFWCMDVSPLDVHLTEKDRGTLCRAWRGAAHSGSFEDSRDVHWKLTLGPRLMGGVGAPPGQWSSVEVPGGPGSQTSTARFFQRRAWSVLGPRRHPQRVGPVAVFNDVRGQC